MSPSFDKKGPATWDEIVKSSAARLAECKKFPEFEAEIQRIWSDIKKFDPPTYGWKGFWDRVAAAYSNEPRLILKEAAAAADLNALAQAAISIIQAQGQK